MLRTKSLTILAAALVLSGSMAMASDWGMGPAYYGTGARTATVTPLGDDGCITQSADNTTIVAGTVTCNAGGITTDNQFYRIYDLDGGHGITGDFTVEEVQYAVETSAGGVPLSIAIYEIANGGSISGGLPAPSCSVNIVQADGALLLDSAVIAGCPPINGSTSDLVVGLLADDCQDLGCGGFFPGSNGLGETGPSYIAAADCGIVNPVTFADIGFPGINLIIDVCADIVDPPMVPAVGTLGALFTILALGAGSGFVIRRRNQA